MENLGIAFIKEVENFQLQEKINKNYISIIIDCFNEI